MAYNLRSLPGRPEGGEAMGMRALFELIRRRFS
jgi:leucyl aminopeptidase